MVTFVVYSYHIKREEIGMTENEKELVEQLKTVTKELTMQIALRFSDPKLERIEELHPIVRKALETINKYEKEG